MAQKTILAVEDDSTFAAYLETVLTELDYAVLEPVATGEDAITRAKTNKPDLILMDINLAGEMNGIEAADRIRSLSNVPIIYLTGHSEASFLEQASVTVPYGYLVKPVTRKELSVTIAMALYRHALDTKLAESDNRLRMALASSQMGVWEWNVATNEAVWSPECNEIFGSADISGIFKSFTNLLHPEDAPRVMVAIERASVGYPLFKSEFRIVRPDGEVRWVAIFGQGHFDDAGAPARMIGTLQDITDRKKAEERLLIADFGIQSSISAISFSDLDGRVAFVNDSFLRLWGYGQAEEVLGRHISEFAMLTEEGIKATQSGQAYIGEGRATKKDGSVFSVQVAVNTVRTNEGKPVSVMASFVDVTEKKRLEEQLRQAHKMEAVGTLAGGVAHDFNNILSVIMGFANLIQLNVDKGEIVKQYIDQIVASSERAAELVRSLLAFSRKQRINLEPRTVNGAVTTTAKLLARLLPEDIRLAIDLTNEDGLSLLDVTQIGQVLMNLATNARDAMPHGGSLTITTERTNINKAFIKTHGFGQIGEYQKLSVSDTGTGMDEATRSRIFEPFFTTKGVGKGTGLGLASTYGIVKQHNGYITVSSTPSKGTTFEIYLPLLNPLDWQEAPVTGEIKGGVETILIAEDDRDVRNTLVKILESHGYTTIEAVDGDDATRVHQEHQKRIDLIILDVVMPLKNGKEAFDEISRADPRVKTVFVSGYTGDIVIEKGIQNKDVDFLQKPISVVTLLTKVREVLDRKP